ncbi:MAG: SpoIIE family protein phosphatase [Chloroherpetonaceae bacterium]|nr:SpoIIE family protein phosphatase [bacterium]
MKVIKNVERFSHLLNWSKKQLLIMASAFLVLRIIGDFVLSSSFGYFSFEDNLLWKFITTFLIIATATGYLSYLLKNDLKEYKENFSEKFSEDLYFLLLLYVIGFALSFPNFNDPELFRKASLPYYVFFQIIGWYLLAISFFTINLLFKWLIARKTKRTNANLKFFKIVFALILFHIFISSGLQYLFGWEALSDTTNAIIQILFWASGILMFFMPLNTNWVKFVQGKEKRKIFWYSTILVIFAYTITQQIGSSDSGIFFSTNQIFPKLNLLVFYPTLLFTIFSFRILVASRARKGNLADDRRNLEILTLSNFNRYILEANTTNRQQLHHNFMDAILSIVPADFGWIEEYTNHNYEISYFHNTNIQAIQNFHSVDGFDEFIQRIESPEIINDIRDEMIPVDEFVHGSVAIIPLFEQKQKIGAIVLCRYEDYAYDIEELQFLRTFADNMAVAVANSLLLEEAIEKRRYQMELMYAQNIQKKIIPSKFPEIANYSIAGISIPANELGGDYFDLIHLKGGIPTILIGDVSGKGVSSALYLAELKGIVLSIADSVSTPIELVTKLNAILYPNIEKQIFITLSAVSLLDDSGNINYIRAGHTPLMIKQNNVVRSVAPKGIALGLASPAIFNNNLEDYVTRLNHLDVCFLYSDGLTEMHNLQNTEFGYKGIMDILNNNNFQKAQDLIDNTFGEISIFKNDQKLKDDLTLVSLIYLGKNNAE